jgi:predicted TIM-barrel fold metal-dependent hydrolase
MTALLKLTSISNVTYGTDYPYFPTDQNKSLQTLGLSVEDMSAIEHGNASRLIPRLEGN